MTSLKTTAKSGPKMVIKGGLVVDESGSRRADVAIFDGTITAVEPDIDSTGVIEIDAGGCVVAPGLVDIHTHLREPGREEAETIETGSRAAALGGFTAVVAMPNTDPVADSESVVRSVQSMSREALCDVAVAGSITVGQKGEKLTPMFELARLGVRMFTDDGRGVQDPRLMRRALEYASMLDVTLAQHCEDEALSAGGHMHEGAVSALLGIGGVPPEAEEIMMLRDIALLRRTNARLHFMHVSTARGVSIAAAGKTEGLSITAEVAPHHFTLTDDDVRTFDPVFKVNPPLRPRADRDALKVALAGGVIDAIATDHAPHVPHIKQGPFDESMCGILGLETALSLAITELELPIERILALMSWQPARIAGMFGEHGGPIVPGHRANICVIDPTQSWVVEPDLLASKSRNTAYAGRRLTGKVRHTIFKGECVVRDGESQR